MATNASSQEHVHAAVCAIRTTRARASVEDLEGMKLESALLSLLIATGSGGWGSSAFSMGRERDLLQLEELLLPQFQSRLGAERGLLEAISMPDVASFRKAVLACTDPTAVVTSIKTLPTEDCADALRREAGKAARYHPTDSHPRDQVRLTCAACGKKCQSPASNLFKACPCMLVAYCGTDCQAAHWKAHKKEHFRTVGRGR